MMVKAEGKGRAALACFGLVYSDIRCLVLADGKAHVRAAVGYQAPAHGGVGDGVLPQHKITRSRRRRQGGRPHIQGGKN